MPDPNHHPDDALLLRYVTGEAPAPLALVLATHVAMCGGCQAAVRQFEAVGGALLAEIDAAPVSIGLLAAVLARLEGPVPSVLRDPPPPTRHDLPMPLRAVIDRPFGELSWRRYGRAISEALLMREGAYTASLVRVAPGAAIPAHVHGGIELTVPLRGAFLDRGVRYEVGDLAMTDGAVTHRPTVVSKDECLCLVTIEGALRFKGVFGPILNYVSQRG